MQPDHLTGLNPPQLEAVRTLQGPLLILAGAGSGKTRVLTRRVANLLHHGVAPWNILAVTFTNKAAAEMKHRVAELVGERASRLHVSTFHSTCVRILRQEAHHLGWTRNFAIWDDDDQLAALREILKEQHLDPKRLTPGAMRGIIDRAKNKLLPPSAVTGKDTPPEARKVYEAYELKLKGANAFDFNDLVNKVVELWTNHPAVLSAWQDRFRYLLVDEYQDTNHAQYQFVRLLAGRDRNVAVVGDDDQSIYAFRGADIRNILDFQKDFPDAKVVKLEQNYRSTAAILRAASGVVKHNSGRMEKTLWTDSPDGERIKIVTALSEEAEADQVAQQIRTLLAQGRKPEDIAIIYRTNARSRPFEHAFSRFRIPFHLVGARRFFDRRVIRDMLAYARLVLNPADDLSFVRVVNTPRRGIGDKAIEAIRQEAERMGRPLLAAAEELVLANPKGNKGLDAFVRLIHRGRDLSRTLPPGELLHRLAEDSGYLDMVKADEEAEDNLRNLDELFRTVAEDDPGLIDPGPLEKLQAFLDRAALVGQDEELESGGRVTLLTGHLCKGLEWPVVFVSGMVEGLFPLLREDTREEAVEEERRLVYVAFTRAREKLILTRSMQRMAYNGTIERCTPSRFLAEIPSDCIEGRTPLGPRPTASVTPAATRAEANAKLQAFLGRHGATAPTAPPPRPLGSPEPAPPPPTGPRRTREISSYAELKVGVRVLHPEYGEGVIRARAGDNANPRLSVEFGGMRLRTFLARFANLEIVLAD